jgi:UPF0755 protein
MKRVAIPIGAGLAALLAWIAGGQALAPVSEEAPPVLFTVAPGASLASVAQDLKEADLVRSARAVEWLGRWRGVASGLRSGEYELSGRLSSQEILAHLVAGRVRTHQIVIPEGLTAVEVAQRLQEARLTESEAFLQVVGDPEVARDLGIEADSLEGYLFPETYQLARGLAPREVVEILVGQFFEVWRSLEPSARAQGLSMREVVVLASIVEKETGATPERPLIAAVFRNRLQRGMRLESDPTVIYGISDFDGNLRRVHLEDITNPYNTYQNTGLPPGPIANPGRDALRAVVHPAEAEYLYFVSRNDGTHYFSRTYAEHTKAVDRYQRRRR